MRVTRAALLAAVVIVALAGLALADDAVLHPLGLKFEYPPADAMAPMVAAQPGGPVGASLDLSAGFPPIMNQGSIGSCASCAVGYALKGYLEWLERGWDQSDASHRFCANYLYNQIDGGGDNGSYFSDNFLVLVRRGISDAATQPYNGSDCITWPTQNQCGIAQDYRNGMVGGSESGWVAANDIAALKAKLDAGIPLVVGFEVDHAWDHLGSGTNYVWYPDGVNIRGGHGVAICGYDDDITDGAGHVGAFKVQNSWGVGWGQLGRGYMAYDAFIEGTHVQYGVYYGADRVGFSSTIKAKVKVNHARRGRIQITLGVGSTTTPDWQYSYYRNLLMDTDAGPDDTHANVYTTLDMTDAAAYWPPNGARNWWAEVEDTNTDGVTGTVAEFSVTEGSETFATTTTLPAAIPDNGSTYAYIEGFPSLTFRAVTANPGAHTDMDASNCPTVTYVDDTGASAYAYPYDGHDITVLVTPDSAWSYTATSSTSDASHQWHCAETLTGTAPTSGTEVILRNYYEQYNKTFQAQTLAGGAPMDAGNYISVTSKSHNADVAFSCWDGNDGIGWADAGAAYAFSSTSSGSNASERWIPLSGTSGTITDATPVSCGYYHQFKPSITLNGTDAGYTVSTEAHTQFGAAHVESGLYTSWSDWCDEATTLTFSDTTTGAPPRTTTDPRSWTVNSAMSATINYAASDASPFVILRMESGSEEEIFKVNETTGDVDAKGVFLASSLDLAESFSAGEALEPGDVVVINPNATEQLVLCRRAYDFSAAGVISSKPGLLLGTNADGKARLALAGRVPCKVDASYGAVAVGDLLTTSATPGHAMRANPEKTVAGCVIGKALEPLAEGRGAISVLVSLW